MKIQVYLITLIATLMLIIGPSGCREKGSAEKAGERVDEVIDNIKHGDAPLKEKGTLEKMGESVDDSIKKLDQK